MQDPPIVSRQTQSSKITDAYNHLQSAVESLAVLIDLANGASPAKPSGKPDVNEDAAIFGLIDSLPPSLHTLAESVERSKARINEALF